MNAVLEKVIGVTKVPLDSSNCRTSECNIGNLITDAIVNTRIKQYVGPYLTDAPVAIVSGGDIRSSAEIGNITRFDLENFLPYENQLVIVNITGKTLQKVLEHSVRRCGEKKHPGEFLQLSGLYVVYDMTKAAGDRVKSVEILCASCKIPHYEKLNDTQTYGVFITSFLHEGRDKYHMLEVCYLKIMAINLNI